MSTKTKWIVIVLSVLLVIAAAVFFSWLHVDGAELTLPESQGITGYVSRLDIGLDEQTGTATHDTINFDMTDAQVADFLQLLRNSSFRRTRYGNSVSFDGETAYAISLSYREENKTEIRMISVLDNELINVGVEFGYLRITDSDFLVKLQAILEN